MAVVRPKLCVGISKLHLLNKCLPWSFLTLIYSKEIILWKITQNFSESNERVLYIVGRENMSRIITNTRIKKIVRGYNLAIGEKRGIVTHILLQKQPIFVGTQKIYNNKLCKIKGRWSSSSRRRFLLYGHSLKNLRGVSFLPLPCSSSFNADCTLHISTDNIEMKIS